MYLSRFLVKCGLLKTLVVSVTQTCMLYLAPAEVLDLLILSRLSGKRCDG